MTRVRAQPLAEPKAPPGRKDRRSRRALVLRTRRDSAGALVTGVCVELAAGQVVAERIVYAGQARPRNWRPMWQRTGRARPLGRPAASGLCPLSNLGRLLRDSGYRQGATVVGAGLAVEVAGLAEWWGPSRSRRGGWSFGLAGLGGPYGDRPWKLYADAPAVTASAVGDQVLLGWRGGREPKPKPGERRYRPLPRRGQFLDVLTVASALAGVDVGDLAGACATFGLGPPGGDDLGDLDRLRGEAHAVVAVYLAELAEVDALGLGLDAAQLVSTGGIASAMWRQAGVAPLAHKLTLPDRVAGAAASAFFGGLVGGARRARPGARRTGRRVRDLPAVRVRRGRAPVRGRRARRGCRCDQ